MAPMDSVTTFKWGEEKESVVPVWDWMVDTVSGFSTARCTADDPLLPPVAGHEKDQ